MAPYITVLPTMIERSGAARVSAGGRMMSLPPDRPSPTPQVAAPSRPRRPPPAGVGPGGPRAAPPARGPRVLRRRVPGLAARQALAHVIVGDALQVHGHARGEPCAEAL